MVYIVDALLSASVQRCTYVEAHSEVLILIMNISYICLKIAMFQV
jgi:hypothetical protein